MASEIVSFAVTVDSREILSWNAQLVDEGLSFSQIFEKLLSADSGVVFNRPLPDPSVFSSLTVTVQKEPARSSAVVTVQKAMPVVATCTRFGYFVRFSVNTEKVEAAPKPANAFALLMNSAEKLALPDYRGSAEARSAGKFSYVVTVRSIVIGACCIHCLDLSCHVMPYPIRF
eukprot:scpid102005/ scgid19109/ 